MKIKKNINFGNLLKKISKRRAFICGIKSYKLTKKEILFLLKYKPWGVILFTRNIKNITQTKNLTDHLKKLFKDKNYPILIDEEGGKVSRLRNILDNSLFNSLYFGKLYSKNINKFNLYVNVYINQITYVLKLLGININTAPVLDIYRKNFHKIVGNRAYSSNPKIISKIGDLIINKYHQKKIATIIKHIPGHGLAKVDSHKKLPIVNKDINYRSHKI